MRNRIAWLKVAVFLAALWPVFSLTWRGFHDDLGANPIEFITHSTGDWTIRFLCITLAITPTRRLLGQPWLIKFRRMLGLFAFFYGTLHLMTYLWLDKFFDVPAIVKDIGKRPFITMGMLAFTAMLPLAITSTAGWIRRLGGKRWQMLHRLIYVSAIAAVIHYYWLVKSDVRLPLMYAAIVGVLLAYRVIVAATKQRAAPQRKTGHRLSPAHPGTIPVPVGGTRESMRDLDQGTLPAGLARKQNGTTS